MSNSKRPQVNLSAVLTCMHARAQLWRNVNVLLAPMRHHPPCLVALQSTLHAHLQGRPPAARLLWSSSPQGLPTHSRRSSQVQADVAPTLLPRGLELVRDGRREPDLLQVEVL